MALCAWESSVRLHVASKPKDSDVDVCVELQTPSMFCLVHIKDELQHLFGCAVDIVRLREDMDKLLKQNIMEEGIYA